MADDDSTVAEVIGEGVADLVIEVFEQPVAGIDQIDFAPHVAKHRGILTADNPRAVNAD